MEKNNRKIGKGLVALYVFVVILGLLFIGAVVAFAIFASKSGDEAFKDIASVFTYHFDNSLALFAFDYLNRSTNIAFALSAFLYALMICWMIILVAGILVNERNGRRVMWWPIWLNLFSLVIYLFAASGSQKYWHIIRDGSAPLELFIITIALLAVGSLYALFAVISYFASMVNAYIHSNRRVGEMDEDHLRDIIKEEIEAAFAKRERKEEIKEEPKAEPVVEVKEEPVIEEPKKELVPTITFWEAAEETWPQLKNPKPLPKEEAKPVPVIINEPVEDEGLDGLSRNPRLPFITRILKAESETKVNYNELKNEILSYGVKSRLSKSGDVFRLHNKKYVKIFLVGKTLKVYLALSPEDYKDTTYPIEDVGYRPNYAEIPLLFKVRSGLSLRRCKELIKDAMEKDGLVKKETKDVNWVSELRTQNAKKTKK